MTVALQRPRKNNTTITTNKNANNTVSTNELIVLLMLSEESIITSNFISPGNVLWIAGKALCTLLAISTVLEPDCFCIIITAPFSPFV